MPRHRKTPIRGSLNDVPIEVEIHHEATGLITTEELSISDVIVGGWYSYSPATYHDPPESDSEVEVDMSPDEVSVAAEKSIKEAELGFCTLLTSPSEILSQLRELAEEQVLDNIDRYLDDGDCD